MILLINVIITNHRKHGFHYNRYGLPGSNRLDIFKYSLASLAILDWSKVIIYCHLDNPYKPRWIELESWIHQLFSNAKVYNYRNWLTKHWRDAYYRDLSSENDRFIWFMGNDDHIFLDYNLDMVKKIIELMGNDPSPDISCYFSHWPEIIRYSGEKPHYAGDTAWFMWNNHDAIQIITKEVFHRWWFNWDWGQRNVTRSDFMKFTINYPLKCYVPFRELVRHFDGYSHALHAPDLCPPLAIPSGFFDKNMKIAYCHPTGLEPNRKYKGETGWIDMNPLRPYRTVAANGVDYRYTLADMPLFWRGRVSTIEVVEPVSYSILARQRNKDMHKLAIKPYKIGGRLLKPLPAEWMTKWLVQPLSKKVISLL
jgi:hypothetical protein